MPKTSSLFSDARNEFHKRLRVEILTVDKDGVASNADKDSKTSLQIANHMATQLNYRVGKKLPAQTSGTKFETILAQFVSDTFSQLQHIRPGAFGVEKVSSRKTLGIAKFEQYRHLYALKEAAESDPNLAISIGRDYTVAPDIVVYRELLTDEEINKSQTLVDNTVALRSDLRKSNGGAPVLIASISAKWTMRSDRAQNSRSEALNLIRNRKGGLPKVVVVTCEPLPSRLSSLALGTGDIDCVYHFALYELVEAARASGNEEAVSLLKIMTEGKRLKDISDLPLDLAA